MKAAKERLFLQEERKHANERLVGFRQMTDEILLFSSFSYIWCFQLLSYKCLNIETLNIFNLSLVTSHLQDKKMIIY